MKYLFFLLIALILIITVSCKKPVPPVGDYVGDFYGNYLWNDSLVAQNDLGVPFNLSESNDSVLIIDNNYSNPLLKKGDSIIGQVFIAYPYSSSGYYSSPKIRGIVNNKFGKYYITGNYTAVNTQYKIINGTFEIVSKNK